MPSMRAFMAATQRRSGRNRSASLSTIPPAEGDDDYLPELAAIAASILYKSPVPSLEGHPVYVLNAAAFPDAFEVDYDSLLAYVLARLPGEEELIAGADYEVVFFAGGPLDNATAEKKQGPSTGWYLQAYHVLSRATRKKLQRLYIVHPRTWVRVLINIFGTIVSPKFRRKIVHVNSLSQLALHIPLHSLLVPPSAYLQDRKISPDVYDPFNTGRRAFGARHPLPKNLDTRKSRLPRVLRETTSFILLETNITTEGLFRIPPHNILSSVIKEAYDRGQQFIVWKEKDATYVSPGMDVQLVDEVRLEDAYGVHLATSLIKTWYRELREPIFPESSYAALTAKYQDPSVEVTPEELVDLILPSSRMSPLSEIAREIITRHLLPLLSAVAGYESSNKMSPENLAICFSMCLVCGSNQMEDGKMSPVLKRILQAAIELWPELRSGMGLEADAFLNDIKSPADPREYEDPLEDKQQRGKPVKDDDEKVEAHRIYMSDADGLEPSSLGAVAPELPPRRSRASSWKKAAAQFVSDVDLRTLPKPRIELPSLPKRKPARHPDSPPQDLDGPESTEHTSVHEPPRYSSLFDSNGRDVVHQVDSPTSYSPADGFEQAGAAFLSDEKDVKAVPVEADTLAKLGVPKRKAVSSGSQQSSPESTSPLATPDMPRNASPPETNMTLARMAAQQVANSLAQRMAGHAPVNRNDPSPDAVARSAPADLGKRSGSDSDAVFRKPSWPASANRQPNIQSLAKPVIPRQSQTVPMPIITSYDGSGGLSAPNVPRPRAPSPGLLKRMNSMESSESNKTSAAASGLEPRRLEAKRLKSVDDLKRLYEERASTAHTLASVSRSSSSANKH